MKTFKELLVRIFYYIRGNGYARKYYDRKYLTGKYFESKYHRILAYGWKWVYYDGKMRKLTGNNSDVPWPVSASSRVINASNIEFHPDDLNNFQGNGNYFQAMGARIVIGRGTWIGPNVGIVASNHDIYNPDDRAEGKDVIIGEKCWIGMNAVVLPGVKLGDHTVVGAGAIVTKSFEEGYCVIAGNPARIIKNLNKR